MKRFTGIPVVLTILFLIVGTSSAAPITWETAACGNGHSYELFDASINWDGANAAAISAGGHLATITSREENLFITSALGGSLLYYHWIGGYQPDGSVEPAGGWSWVTGETFAYNNWMPGTPPEPNNWVGNENRIIFDHAIIADGYAWNDLIGSWNSRGYVVEYEPAPVPEPSTMLLLGSGLVGLVGYGRRRMKK